MSMMKKLLFILFVIMLCAPAHAYTLKGCVRSDHGNWECTYHLHLGIAAGPQNPLADVTFGASDPELTKSAAKKITDRMAYEVEHPDQQSIDEYTAKIVKERDLQKAVDNRMAQEIQKSASFINPDEKTK